MSSEIRTLCVYCSSSCQVHDKYRDIARQMGVFCAGKGITIVFGGGRVGLMGVMADAALEEGGKVVGVMPRHLEIKEIAHQNISELYITETMHERQMKMAELSDGFIVLPGGLGTLAEFFEIVTWRQLGLHKKPIAIINAYGYWDSLLEMIKKTSHEKFLHKNYDDLFTSLPDVHQLDSILGKKAA